LNQPSPPPRAQHEDIDLGTHILPRAKLAETLPDLGRSERYLQKAMKLPEHMAEQNGALPR
jgi:hypothetical protein